MQGYLHQSIPEPLYLFLGVLLTFLAFKVMEFFRTRKKVQTLMATLDLISEERRLKNKIIRLSDFEGIDRRKIIPSSFIEKEFTKIEELDRRVSRITDLARKIAENDQIALSPLDKAELLKAENDAESARLKLLKVS